MTSDVLTRPTLARFLIVQDLFANIQFYLFPFERKDTAILYTSIARPRVGASNARSS